MMLTIGPITRRAEDLMPMLRVIAGPDGIDPYVARDADRRPGRRARSPGMRVLLSEDTSYVNVSRELRAARLRAAEALEARGRDARGRVAALDAARARALPRGAEARGGRERRRPHRRRGLVAREASARGSRRKGPHTRALRLLLFSEWLTGKMPQGRLKKAAAARQAFQDEVTAAIGNGILLHPTHPRVAPRPARPSASRGC